MASIRHKKLVLFVVTLFFVSFSFLFWNVYGLVAKPLLAQQEPPIIINFDRAASAAQFVQTLKEKNLIHCQRPLLLIIRVSGLSQRLKAGVYQIKPGETAL